MNSQTIEAILLSNKTIETRFSQAKIVPFGVVEVGDLVYMKPPGDEIVGQFRVKKVIALAGLEEKDIREIFERFGNQIGVGQKEEDERYLQSKLNSKFGTLIFVGESERFITSPIKIKKRDLRGWVVLDQ